MISPPILTGGDVEILAATDLNQQARKIQTFISKLVTVEMVPGASIVVLIADKLKRKRYTDVLGRLQLPSGLVWGRAESTETRIVTLETVARFKGLESQIVILWGLDDLPSQDRSGTLYVGISRAKSILAICGNSETCSEVLNGT